MPNYLVKTGINYRVNGAEKRAEPGDTVELPPATAEWMEADGIVEKIAKPAPRKASK